MNERIKSLALQSMANVRFWNAEEDAYEVGHDELAKFAQLLIQECMNELYKKDLWHMGISAALVDLFKEE